jgi:hypothetical protein
MMGSSEVERALNAVLAGDLGARCLSLKKNCAAVENGDIKSTHRLCRMMRLVISSIKEDPTVTPEQLQLCAEYSGRIRVFDPRRNSKTTDEVKHADLNPPTEREEWLQELEAKIPKHVKQSDGYEPGFLNLNEAIARVRLKHADKQPPNTNSHNDELLRTFLGESIPLDAHSARQIWLSLANEFKKRGGSFEKTFTSLFPQQAAWVQTALCSFSNRQNYDIGSPSPNCLAIMDEIGFRC